MASENKGKVINNTFKNQTSYKRRETIKAPPFGGTGAVYSPPKNDSNGNYGG